MRKTMQYLLLPLALFIGIVSGKAQTCCDYTLLMHDTYGDGWNGGFLQLFVNGTLTGTYSASGTGSSASFQLCNGDSMQLVYTAGSWEEENSYELFSPFWVNLFADGTNPATGIVFDSLADCSGTPTPGNHPCSALPLDTINCLTHDNTGYIGSGINAGCANYTGGDVWFTMLIPPSGNISLQTDSGSINDTGIAAWSSASGCGDLHYLGCDDDGGPGYFSFLMLYNLTPGETLYVQVFGYNGATGSFNLCAHDLGTVVLDSTELPLVMINTLGQQIVADTKIDALMEIKYNGPGNITHITDPSNVYSGNIGIEIRGASSSGYPQTPFNIETRTSSGSNNNVTLLGMPAENDWVLLSNYNDRSLVRNTLAYKLFGEMGNYSVRTQLCEVLIDSVYKGIYVFGEKIKRDQNRVNIANLTTSDSIGDELTGGYILEQNYWSPNTSFQSNYAPIDHPGFDVHFVYKEPEADSITTQQKDYIAAFVDSLEDALYGPQFMDTAAGYRKYLDEPSFIDYFLINELSRNNDGFKKSVYFHKDKQSKGGKLKAGPVWDFDWAWKTMYGCSIFDNNTGEGWAHHINDCPTDNYSCGWYVRLLQDSTFNNSLRCRYDQFRATVLDTTHIFNYLDSIRNLVVNAQQRHFRKWPILGVSGPAPEVNPIATTYHAEIDTLKQWIRVRLNWLDANIPGHCVPSTAGIITPNKPVRFEWFPNPTNGMVHFIPQGILQSEMQLMIYDLAGKLIETRLIPAGSGNFDISITQKGMYYISINQGKQQIQCGKLVVL